MKQIYFTLLLAVMSLFTSQIANAYDFEVDGICYNLNTSDMTASVTYKDDNYGSYSGDIAIQSYVIYKGRKINISSIANKAFYKCENLSSITMANGIREIGVGAFGNCTNLAQISIPQSVVTIHKQAFTNCTSLKTVVLPNTIRTIDEEAFCNCKNLSSVNIPDSVTIISKSLFRGCVNLSELKLHNRIEIIGDEAFYDCKALSEFIIPSSVKSVGVFALGRCKIQNLYIEDCENTLHCGGKYPGGINLGISNDNDYNYVYVGRNISTIGSYETDHENGEDIGIRAKQVVLGKYCTTTEIGTWHYKRWEYSNEKYGDLLLFSNRSKIDKVSILNGNLSTSHNTHFNFGDFDSLYVDREEGFPLEGRNVKVIEVGSNIAYLYIPWGWDGRDYPLRKLILGSNIINFQHSYYLSHCEHLDSIISYVRNPYPINPAVFSGRTYTNTVLIVPNNTISKYMQTNGWKNFFDIQEMDEETTPIASAILKEKKNIMGRYNASGLKLNSPQKGINIIKYSDGTTKKVIIK
uniref:Leucine-rich repeat domain-containing protein n=1 Tax=Prevotella sp. GTC17253 TaxID=3236793 RepID=A0AB33IQC1_9BACT